MINKLVKLKTKNKELKIGLIIKESNYLIDKKLFFYSILIENNIINLYKDNFEFIE